MAAAAPNATTCLPPMKATSNGMFQGDDPLHYALPLLIIQICLVLLLTRGLAYLLRPPRQPRVIAEIMVSLSIIMLLINMSNTLQLINFNFYLSY